MSLNWSFEVILTFVCLVPFSVSVLISLRQYMYTRYQHSFFLFLTWVFYFFWAFFHGLSKLYLIKSLYWSSGLFITGYLVSIILFGDALENDVKISKKMLLVLILQSICVVSLYDDSLVVEEVYPNLERGLRLNNSYLQLIIFIQMLISTILVMIIMYRMYRNVPPSIKKRTFIMFFGVAVCFAIGIFYVILGGSSFIPGLNMIFNLIGALLFGISFLKEPKMLHVLSFKTLRMQVIDTKSGIGIYSYTWNSGREIYDEDLFSGMVQGISLIVQESVKRGELEEIKLSKGILLIAKVPESSIVCVLVATKSTAPLRQALHKFSVRFGESFHDKFNDISTIDKFQPASNIINECFPFLYDESCY